MNDDNHEGKDLCPQCEQFFTKLGTHWSRSSECSYPLPTDEEQAILDGLMLSGANLANRHRDDANSLLRIVHHDRDVLEWVASVLGGAAWVATIESYDVERSSPHVYADVADPTDLFVLRTRANPHLDRLVEWYRGDERVVPDRVLESLRARRPLCRTVVALKGRRAPDRPRIHLTLSTTRPSETAVHALFASYAPRVNHGSSSYVVRLYNSTDLLVGLGPWPACVRARLHPDTLTEPEVVCPRCNGRFRKRTHVCERRIDGEVVRVEDASTETRQGERPHIEGLRARPRYEDRGISDME